MEPASASIGLYDRVDINKSLLGSNEIYEMSLEELLNMEVTTVSKSSERISDAPGIISVLSSDELKRFSGNTLKELLERIPGLIGSTVYMTDRSLIAPRGDQVLASSSHVLLLINGRPVREALEGGIKGDMYESFPISIIERIEVIRGPGSVLYGSNAFSAVINVITQQSKENDFNVELRTNIEGGFGGSVKTNLNLGDVNINLAARYFKEKEWETDWQFATPWGDSTVNVSIPDISTGAYMDIDYKNIRLMAAYTEWENYYFVTDYAFIFPAYGTALWKKGFVDLGYGMQPTENWNMDFNVTYTRSTFKTQNWPSTNRDSYEMVGEWSNFLNPTEKLGIVFGGLFNYFQGKEWGPTETGEKFYYTDADRYSAGAYAQVNYRLISSLNLIGGIQANKVEGIDFNLVPRAGLIWYPVPKINVKAFYSQAFRAPSINEFSIISLK
jgi:outer membrane receptor for ferrienterochelin and colicin